MLSATCRACVYTARSLSVKTEDIKLAAQIVLGELLQWLQALFSGYDTVLCNDPEVNSTTSQSTHSYRAHTVACG